VSKHKLSWFNPAETPAGQHVQAVATWALIYHTALSVSEPASAAYHRSFQTNRKAHFAASAVRKAMTMEQVMDGARHKRDGALYK
jgi:hypothetical protein